MVLENLIQYSEYIISAVIFLFSIILSRIVKFGLKKYAKKVASKTKSMFDDIIIDFLGRPISLGIILGGIYFAVLNLKSVSSYFGLLNQTYTILYMLFAGYFATKFVGALLFWYSKEISEKTKTKADEQFLPIIRKILYTVIWIIVLVTLLGYFGIQITGIVAALGVGGLAVALAFQDTLKEFFAGAYIVIDRPVRIGDYVELDSGEKGTVMDIGWRSTKIRVLGNNILIIPNSKLATSKIINYNYPQQEMSVVVPCGVSYDSDLERVEKVTIDVAKKVLEKTDGAVKDFEPFIRYKEFGDSNINFSVILRVKSYTDKFKLVHEFIKALKKRYDKEKIEIAYPSVNVYQRK